jgi:hypothetical protein
VFSQTLILNEKGDTTICFTIGQGKYLLGEHYKLQECQALLNVCESQLILTDSVTKNQQLNIGGYKNVISNQSILLSSQATEIKTLEGNVEQEQKNVRTQKVYKWITAGCGVAVTILMGYLYLTK